MEVDTSLGVVGKVFEAGWSVPDHLRKVLLRRGSGGATICVRNLGADGSDAAKARGGTRGFPAENDVNEGSKVMGRDLLKGGGGKVASGVRKKTSLGINQQESGNGSGLGGPTSNIRGLCEGDGIRGRGGVAQAVVETSGCGTTAEGHVKIYFGRSVGAAAMGI